MVVSAPRLEPELLAALAELDDATLPIAEISRRLGAIAAAAGLKRPSYEQVRVRRNELRLERELRRDAREEVVGEIADIFLRPRGPERVHDEIFVGRSETSPAAGAIRERHSPASSLHRDATVHRCL